MTTLRITIQAEPTAKGRPRMSFVNGIARTYTPTKTKEAEDFIKYRLLRYKDRCFPAHIPVRLTVTFYRTKSNWLPKHEVLPVRRPDTDNLLKLTLDALNGILVTEDAQITSIVARKRWSDDGEGHITLKLEEDKL